MRQNIRKLLMLILSIALVMEIPVSVSAEESEQSEASGAGRIEAISKPDVYQVILPTDVNGIFDFIFDPQRLIEETNAAAYGGASFEKGATVFFHRLDGRAAEEYSSSSDHITIINRSTVPVDIQVDVVMSPESLGGITMTADSTFSDDTGTSLYLALTDGEYTIPIGTESSFIHTTLPAAPEEAFEYSYDPEHGNYTYGLKADLNGISFPEYSFQLTGAVNEKGDWAAVGKAAPTVNVTWKVTPTPGQSIHSDEVNPIDTKVFSQTLKTVPIEQDASDEELFWNRDGEHEGETMPEKEGNPNSNSVSEKDGIPDSILSGDSGSVKHDMPVEKNTSDLKTDSEKSTAPDVDKTSYHLKAGKPVSIDVDLGSGDAAAEKVVSVKWKESDDELLISENTEWIRYEDRKIVFSKEWVEKYLADPDRKQEVLVVTFDDGEATKREITLIMDP